MPLFRLRRRHVQQVQHEEAPVVERKPVYIYPGVIRMSKKRAVAIDGNCPATLFSNAIGAPCAHHDTCSICLEVFMPARDIIRRLPCGHVFHSKCTSLAIKSRKLSGFCVERDHGKEPGNLSNTGAYNIQLQTLSGILSWVCTADRCPNCNEPMINRAETTTTGVLQNVPTPNTAGKLLPESITVPDVSPSTLYEMTVDPKDASHIARANTRRTIDRNQSQLNPPSRVYSFLLHDNARFLHLLEHGR